MKISELKDKELVQLINNRWASSETLWDKLDKVYKKNTKYYDCEMDGEQALDYILKTPVKKAKVRSNRIFTNVEAVINTLIANPPKPNVIPTRQDDAQAVEVASLQEQYFSKKYDDLNIKEVLRKGLRNLYFARLIVLKPYWCNEKNDFDVKTVDPRKVRFSKNSTSEDTSDFAIEEVECCLEDLLERFPNKEEEILKSGGFSKQDVLLKNPTVTYKEAWIESWLVCKYKDIVLKKQPNPYWDWDGIPMTQEEYMGMEEMPEEMKRETLRLANEEKETRMADEEGNYEAYKYNYFDKPRKPYIFATVLNNENTPIGRTDFIQQAAPLQEAVDRRKQQIDENAMMINGILKVDSSVMDKSDAQKLRFETNGIIWGKGVSTGVQREMGQALPAFVFDDMQDSRNEIDNIMAATSAFRGEREGQETKAGRLALIEQSFLRLNELVQVVDYVMQELFSWFYQLAKLRYTETHYAKVMGSDNSVKVIELQRDDFETGTEIKVIPGKTLPEDKRFRFERAQEDVMRGIISPIDYVKEAGYQNPQEIIKNAEMFKVNPLKAAGVTDEELANIAPPAPPMMPPVV